MATKNSVQAITMTSRSSSTVGASYLVINADGLTQPCFLIRIVNDSDQDVTVSYDGTNDHDYIRSGETLQLPLQSNSQPSSFAAILAKGTKVYVKGTAGTGNIYLIGYYQGVT